METAGVKSVRANQKEDCMNVCPCVSQCVCVCIYIYIHMCINIAASWRGVANDLKTHAHCEDAFVKKRPIPLRPG